MSGHVGHESAPRCPKCKATQRRTKFHQMRSRTLPTVIAKDAAAKEANVCSRKMGTTLTKAKNLCYRCHHFLLHREDHITMHGHYVTRVRDCHEKERKHEENMEEKKTSKRLHTSACFTTMSRQSTPCQLFVPRSKKMAEQTHSRSRNCCQIKPHTQ